LRNIYQEKSQLEMPDLKNVPKIELELKSPRCLMSESLLDESSISCRNDLADFNLGFSKIPVAGFSISIFSDSCLTLGVRLNAGTSNVFAKIRQR
jgi:hypothetical protein